MGQVTIYLDAKTERKARAAARAEGVPLSKWIARRIERPGHGEWPESIRALAGAWADAPSARKIRRSQGKDVRRDKL
ncbi:MAG: CopG family transcriptional regulator [Betaproteobacteria bacterium]